MTLSIKCLFILRFCHWRHFYCLKLFETLHLPENERKHEYKKKIKKKLEGASSIDTRPSRKMLTADR